MAQAFKCDVCGKLYCREEYPKYVVYKAGVLRKALDICEECNAQLEQFMEGNGDCAKCRIVTHIEEVKNA